MVRVIPLVLLIIVVFICLSFILQQSFKKDNPVRITPYQSNEDSLHFLVVGNQGRGNKEQENVANGMNFYCLNVKECQFIIGVGNNFYEYGVQNTLDTQFQSKFESIYKQSALKDLKWYLTLGNKDYGGNTQAQIDYSLFNNNTNWIMPNYYYSFKKQSRLGKFNVTFVMTDTTPLCETDTNVLNVTTLNERKKTNNKQLEFIENVMKDGNEMKIVVGHHPIYSVGESRGNEVLRNLLEPLLHKHKIKLHLSGHDPLLQYFYSTHHPIIHYVSSGGGSGNIQKVSWSFILRRLYNNSGFISVDVKESFIQVTALNRDGKGVFNFKINI